MRETAKVWDSQRSKGVGRLCSFVATLAFVWALAPQDAHADVGAYIGGLLPTSVCQLSGLTIQVAAPVTMSVPASGTTQVTYTVSATGACTGLGAGPFSLTGSGAMTGTPTCADFVSSGTALMQVGTFNYPTVQFTLSGPTTAPQMTIVNSTSGVDAGAAQLSLTTASLNACMQPGGTTTLQYTGTVVVAF